MQRIAGCGSAEGRKSLPLAAKADALAAAAEIFLHLHGTVQDSQEGMWEVADVAAMQAGPILRLWVPVIYKACMN